MSPAIEVVFPEWPPRALADVRAHWRATSAQFTVEPNNVFAPGPDGFPLVQVVEPEAERWDVSFGYGGPDGWPEITVYVEPVRREDPEFARAVGWPARGLVTALAWKSSSDIVAGVRTIHHLAYDIARALCGIVALEGWRNRPPLVNAGHLYVVGLSKYADADLFGHLVEQPGFDATGYL